MKESKQIIKENNINEKEGVDKHEQDSEDNEDKPENTKEELEFKGKLYIYMKKMIKKYIIISFTEKKIQMIKIYDEKDRNCRGTATLKNDDQFFIKTKCSLTYEQHNYVKEIIAYNKIKINKVT